VNRRLSAKVPSKTSLQQYRSGGNNIVFNTLWVPKSNMFMEVKRSGITIYFPPFSNL